MGADADAINDNRVRPNPDILADGNPATGDRLIFDGNIDPLDAVVEPVNRRATGNPAIIANSHIACDVCVSVDRTVTAEVHVATDDGP
jgi:hypothetical protein